MQGHRNGEMTNKRNFHGATLVAGNIQGKIVLFGMPELPPGYWCVRLRATTCCCFRIGGSGKIGFFDFFGKFIIKGIDSSFLFGSMRDNSAMSRS